jgi:hypothetical protein
MNSVAQPPPNNSLQDEVERLRALAPDTKALYREVASTLFFRFGIAPTANRLHQLVGKGSMATAASVLAKFWQDLREHGRLRLAHPAVPEQLREVGGELIGQIWKTAFDQAHEDLAGARAELQDEGERARHDAFQARHAAGEEKARAEQLARTVEEVQARIHERDRIIAERDWEASQLRADVSSRQIALEDRRREVEQIRQTFSKELGALRAAIALTEERARGSERRALSEIETARRAASDIAKASAAERKRLEAENARIKKNAEKRDAELAALRERLTRSDASRAQVAAQLKAEEVKFSKLLAKIRPGSVAGGDAIHGGVPQQRRKRT